MNNEVYPVVIPDALLLPDIRKLNGCAKYILFRIIGLSKRCENKQIRISNSLLKYEMGYGPAVIRRSLNRLEDLKLIAVDKKSGCRRVINVLFDIESLQNQQNIQPKAEEKVNKKDSDPNDLSSVIQKISDPTDQVIQSDTVSDPKDHSSVIQKITHNKEYKKEEIDIYRESIYKKILNDLSEGSISKIFMHDPSTGDQLDSYIPFNYDPKEAVDSEGNCLFTKELLDPEGYNLSQWMATNITYLGELCLMGKYGDECFPIYAESLLKRWNPKKAPLGKFLNIAVPNDFKGFKPRVIDYVEQYLGENVVFPAIKKIIKQRTSPSKVLEVLFSDYPQYFSAVKHDMDFGRYIYRLMYEVIKGDCEDVYTPYDSNRDFPTDEERAFDWGQQWFEAWSTDPQCLNKEAQEIALGIKPLHKELYGKEVMFDAFFD
jgi:hypothetical protein|nr:MAG TPA: helix-turn-helix domain protein [Caudoviricetes sp.]